MTSNRTGSLQAKDRLWRTLRKEFGEKFDPILEMARIGMDQNNDTTTRLAAWKEVAQYVQPKLKATEVTHEQGTSYRQMSDTELAARLLSQLERGKREEARAGEEDSARANPH